MVSPVPSLVTLDQAKRAARYDLSQAEDNADLNLRLEVAHALVLDYVNNRVADSDDWLETILAWDRDTVPKQIKGAILAMFVHLSRFRGDDADKEAPPLTDGNLPDSVRMYLTRFRDPTVA